MVLKVPDTIAQTHASFCPGCGHGIIARLMAEAVEEAGLSEKTIVVVDVACGSLMLEQWNFDTVQAAHGRPIVTAAGVKHVRKDCAVFAHIGDGAAYAIGMAETMHAALRNDNVIAIVVNNCVFGMTGGQMSPTTLLGQKTITAPKGRDYAKSGQPFDVVKALGGFDIAYLARASVDSPAAIRTAGKYVKKALKKHMDGQGFCLIEFLSPCPTNWKMSPADSMAWIREKVIPSYATGEFVDKEAGSHDN